MQKKCYCLKQDCYDCFTCQSCKQLSHWNCYGYQATDKQPQSMRCLICNLQGNNPIFKIEKFATLKINSQNGLIIKNQAQEFIKYIDFEVVEEFTALKNKQLILAIFCTKLKDPQKLYEWPSKNIYVEFNKLHHIEYQMHNYGFVPSTCIQKGLNTVLIKVLEPLENLSLFGVAYLRQIKMSEIRATILDIGKEKVVEQIIQQQTQLYKQKLMELQEAQKEGLELGTNNNLIVQLIDPLTMQQIEVPVKGKQCQHLECFDLNSFLIMNEKSVDAQRWKCPICNLIIPYDQLVTDFIILETMHSLKKKYPKYYHLINKAQLTNEFEVEIENSFRSKHKQEIELLEKSKSFNQYFKINGDLQKLEGKQFQLFQFILEFIKKDSLQTLILTYDSAYKMLKKLKEKNLFYNIENKVIQIVQLFQNLFDLSEYFDSNIFQDKIALYYLDSLQDFELICKTILEQTTSGLFIKYLRLFKLSPPQMQQAITQFCLSEVKQKIDTEKITENILAASYDKKKSKISLGKNYQELIICFSNNKQEQDQRIITLSKCFPNMFFNTEISSYYIIRNAINIVEMIDETGIEPLQIIYSQYQINKNKNTKEIFKLILYILSKRYRKYEKIWESPQLQSLSLGDIEAKFKNLEYHGDYYYL